MHPSFERILAGRYDKGDRGVRGLDDIVTRAAAMVEAERPRHALIFEAEEFFSQILAGSCAATATATTP